MSAALLLLAAALCVAPWRGAAAERLRGLVPGPTPARRGTPSLPATSLSRALHRLRRRTAGPVGTEPLARTLDLLAVALLAGLPTHLALAAVADAVDPTDPDVAAPLRAAAARVRLGATPAEAWRDVPGAGRLAPVAPVLARATDGGGSVRSALDHAARRLRSDADAAATARAERAAVLVAGPLGLCFLPAFVCLGVVPVVVGLAGGMLPGVLP
ncbi:type II secretion system F family protein [Rhodococcus sp. IEGM 1408]|uniref:type II secretion system F family protein n=1 Tax=Rhodococcus sp. IEGM 1408 TaxID=3082220 RepID=UPI0029556B7A|nr:type II secretion system F family protein [Rhodococcus sp. IEGM 1408]MDV8002250.1 type II secretion system F family protein [Rhodococcus sp. IEGM 1408]